MIDKEYTVDRMVSWKKKNHKEELEGAGICRDFIQRAPLTRRILEALRERSRGRVGQRLRLGILGVWGGGKPGWMNRVYGHRGKWMRGS